MEYLSYVNTKMGTNNHQRFSTGNALPLCQLPFGMVSFCPQTERQEGKQGWFYNPNVPFMEGIRLTHQPSPWIGDYATILFMPQCDVLGDTTSSAWSSFLEDECELRPDYIKVRLLRPKCTLQLVPTQRCGVFKLDYEREMTPYLSMLSTDSRVELVENGSNDTITLHLHGAGQADAPGFKGYLVVKCKDFDKSKLSVIENDGKQAIHIPLLSKNTEVRVGLSYLSFEQALLNMEREVDKKSFEELKENAKSNWEEKLSRIKIEADEDTLKTFYSCMYRVFLFPQKAYEIDDSGRPAHYAPLLHAKRMGVRYTGSGFWDTYRTQFPLLSMIAKEEYKEILKGFIADYKDGGWLPRWSAMGEVGCMPSTLIEPVIADGAIKGLLDDEDLFCGFLGMAKNVLDRSIEPIYGRRGMDDFIKYGYVPSDLYRESVNLTVDFSYGDYCVGTVAGIILERYAQLDEDSPERSRFNMEALLLARDLYKLCLSEERMGAYKNLYNKERGFIVPRDSEGVFKMDFDPYEWSGDYTESSAWQGLFSPVHDLEGLAKLMGGEERLLERLDQLISTEADFRVSGYGSEIHEMSEMAQGQIGQLAISNQPSFHIPFIYAYFKQAVKTRQLVRDITQKMFSWDKGFPGDEDNGSMASWYVLANIGRYPICPGKDKIVKYKPLVKIIEIKE
ncbi:MAG: GH92 family glycosyl hydrolase [Clostridia bacterium]|nr:GH92 family glycosyl hydrolase [Clostridia bacterium]